MLRFPRDINLDFISQKIEKLNSSEASSIQIPAKIPPGSGFAVVGCFIQLLAAWSRYNDCRVLQVAGEPVEEMLTNLAQEPHGSAAIYFAQQVTGAHGFEIGSDRARRYLIPVIRAMQTHDYRATSGARGVHLCCYHGSTNEYLTPFYGRGDARSLRDSSEFVDLVNNIIGAFEPAALNRLPPASLRFISSIVFELFSNTHDHARTDEAGNIYPEGNVRGIIARTIEFREDRRESHINAHVHRYMTKATLQQEQRRPSPEMNRERVEKAKAGYSKPLAANTKSKISTRFLEFTIYDTGPGLARNWAKRKEKLQATLDFDEELKLVSECFAIGSTTKTMDGVGQGLANSILALKKLGAFMVLRTGRTFLYQDFLSKSEEVFSPEHWHPDQKEQPYLPGTTYTIVVPLNRRVA
ncbi:hypothetical protein ABE485_00165 [Achromobacter spanius]|uniref:hypothetical protein n=1 Tax=Achromobacter spanius TaxID=217203 RepID=UPI00320A73FB